MITDLEKSKQEQKGTLFINLGSYLQKLKAIEYGKPEWQRLSVPSLSELARCVNSNSGSMSRLARGQITMLNLKLAKAVIKEMRLRGFQMEIWDLIDYIGPDARPRRYIVGFDSGFDSGDESDSPDDSEISDAGG